MDRPSEGDDTMKRTIPTPAVLMAAILFAAAGAHAQSGNGSKAYPPGPSGQAAAQTTNVNVVNTPTVNVGNAVTVKPPQRTPLFIQADVPIASGMVVSPDDIVSPPAGQRMVIESVNVYCESTLAQAVGVKVYKPGFTQPVLSLLPASMVVGSVLMTAQSFPAHLEVDDSLVVSSFRPQNFGHTGCTVTFMGYFTPAS